MALRWVLPDLSGSTQLSGSIMVEKPWHSAAAAPPSTPSAAATLSAPATPSAASTLSAAATPSAAAATTTAAAVSTRPSPPAPVTPQELLPEDRAVFHCRGCWAVLGDSLHLCAQEQRLGAVVCFKVSKEVTCEKSLMIGLEGGLTGCTYNPLSCQSCGFIVGFILYSTSRQLARLRGLFCFFMDNILCYILKKQIIIEASKVNFPVVTFSEQVQELKKKVVKLNFRIEFLTKKLEELVERQRYIAGALGLPPGYAIVRIH